LGASWKFLVGKLILARLWLEFYGSGGRGKNPPETSEEKSGGEQQPWREEKSDGHVLCAPLLNEFLMLDYPI
jgi:hypothetical protein